MIRRLRSLTRRSGLLVAGGVLSISVALAGVGASVVWRLVVFPVEADRPDQLVVVREIEESGEPDDSFTVEQFEHIAASSAFESVAAIGYQSVTLNVSGTARAAVSFVTPEFFPLLGRPVDRGRDLRASDFADGATPVAILSDYFWRESLGRPSDILGRDITIGDTTVTIVGIAQRGVIGTRLNMVPAAFLPMPHIRAVVPSIPDLLPAAGADQTAAVGWVTIVARLRPGESLTAAEQVLRNSTAARLPQAAALSLAPLRDVVAPVTARLALVGATRLFLTASLAFLLLGATTLSIVALLHLESRRPEVATRLAMGATRASIVAITAGEVVAVILFAVVLAFPLAAAVIRTSGNVLLPGGIRIESLGLTLDKPAQAALGLSGLLALLVVGAIVTMGILGFTRGGIPVLSAMGGGPSIAPRLRRGLVAALVSLSIAVLGGAVFATRTVARTMQIDLGYDAERMLYAGFSFTEHDRAQRAEIIESLAMRIRLSPAVEGVNVFYWAGAIFDRVYFDNRNEPFPGLVVPYLAVDRAHFEGLGLGLVAGQTFTQDDLPGQPPAAVISLPLAEELTRRNGFATPDDVIGHTLFGVYPEQRVVIVGVVDKWVYNLRDPRDTVVYVLKAQREAAGNAGFLARPTFVIDTNDAAAAKRAVTAAVQTLAPELPPPSMQTAEEGLQSVFVLQHLASRIMGVFSAVALALTFISLHALVKSIAVSRRRDLAIRVALGAGMGRLALWFATQIAALVGIAVLVGSAALWVWFAVMSSYLVGLTADDLGTVVTILCAASVSVLVGALAPAVLRVNRLPAQELRQE